MDVFLEVLRTQWLYITLSIILVGATFLIKKKFTQFFDKFCKIGLAVTATTTAILALFFHQPDLFLLIPIFIFCCELFNYELCCKIASILAIDYILIFLTNLLYENGITNLIFNNIIFYLMQIGIVVLLIITIDKHFKLVKIQSDVDTVVTDSINTDKTLESKQINQEVNEHIQEVLSSLAKSDNLINTEINDDFDNNSFENLTSDTIELKPLSKPEELIIVEDELYNNSIDIIVNEIKVEDPTEIKESISEINDKLKLLEEEDNVDKFSCFENSIINNDK